MKKIPIIYLSGLPLSIVAASLTFAESAAEVGPRILYEEIEHYELIENVYRDIISNYKGADQTLDSLLKTATDAEKQQEYEWAKNAYQKIIQKYPHALLVKRGQLDLARMNVLSSLKSGDDAATDAAIKKLLTDFSDNEHIAEAVHHTAYRCRLSGKHKKADRLDGYVTKNQPQSDYALWAQMDKAEFNIDLGNEATAQAAIDKLITDFSSHPRIAEAVHHVAFHYQRLKKYDKAQQLDEYVIAHWPTSDFALWAQMDIAEFNIDLGNEAAAQAAIDNLIAKFHTHPRIAEAAHHVAFHYQQLKKYDEAQQLDEYVIAHWPTSDFALWAQMDIAEFNTKRGDEAAADAAVTKLLTNFSKHPRIAEAVHHVAFHYQQLEKYDKAVQLYQRNVKYFSKDNKHTMWSQVEIIKSLIRDGNEPAAEAAVNKLVTDFSKQPTLQTELSNVGDTYARVGAYDKAGQLYQYILDHWPGSKQTLWAKAVMVKLNTAGENEAAAQKAIDNLITDFENDPSLAQTLWNVAEIYYCRAFSYQKKGLNDKFKHSLEKVINLGQRLREETPASNDTIEALFFTADCYYRLGQSEKAIEYYKTIVDNWPDFEYAWLAQHRIAKIYKFLLQKSAMSDSAIQAELIGAYQRLVQNYPDCPAAKAARNWLENNVTLIEGGQK